MSLETVSSSDFEIEIWDKGEMVSMPHSVDITIYDKEGSKSVKLSLREFDELCDKILKIKEGIREYYTICK